MSANLKTTPIDKNRYNEWVMCMKKTEGDEDACKPMRQLAISICPDEWTAKWDEERDEGRFAGVKWSG